MAGSGERPANGWRARQAGSLLVRFQHAHYALNSSTPPRLVGLTIGQHLVQLLESLEIDIEHALQAAPQRIDAIRIAAGPFEPAWAGLVGRQVERAYCLDQ